jgi:hypothetical protein
MDNKTLFNSEKGFTLISILLGFALASIMFQFKCNSNCVSYQLKIDDITKIYNYNKKCYKFKKIYI